MRYGYVYVTVCVAMVTIGIFAIFQLESNQSEINSISSINSSQTNPSQTSTSSSTVASTQSTVITCQKGFSLLPNGNCLLDDRFNPPKLNTSFISASTTISDLSHHPTVTLSPDGSSTRTALQWIVLDNINSYRKQNGLNPLSLGDAKSPNLYAQELLDEKCIHHIDSKGQGAMMRYQTNGDTMFLVSENIGYEFYPHLSMSAEIKDLNYQMLYNDSSENWSHKTNMLDPNATSVSIGVAFDKNDLIVIVEDFQTVLPSGYDYDPSDFQTQPEDVKHCW